ncbi:TadE family protein [Phytomonospora sp. NPDC050363]|uniref:TadE family protein n=1 Tax=Phytomonospora sp. NPDC050363 TaxID=3155642 RepID=UPI0033C2C20D
MRRRISLTVTRLRERLGDGEAGGASLELAIVAPALLLLVFGALQTVAVIMAKTAATQAAAEGSNGARAYQAELADGYNQADQFLARAGDWLTGPTVDISNNGTEVTATVTGDALSLVPGFDFSVTSTVHGTVEEFTRP